MASKRGRSQAAAPVSSSSPTATFWPTRLQEHGVEAVQGRANGTPLVRETLASDERVNDFLERPLSGAWPYLWLDATYLKVRQGGRIVSVAVIIAVAANTAPILWRTP